MTGMILSLALAGGSSAPAHPRPIAVPYPVPVASPVIVQAGYPIYPPRIQPYPYPPVPLPTPVPPYPPAPAPFPAPGALTIPQFAATFQPFPGTYSLVVIHPRSGQAVPLTFTLPPSLEVPRVKTGSDWIKFDYRRGDDIEIEFRRNGTIDIDYDD